MDNNQLFYCYSGKLKSFLLYKKKIRYLHKGHNANSQRDFWVFTRNDELNNALTEWSHKK